MKRGAVDARNNRTRGRPDVLLERRVVPFLTRISPVDESERSVEEAPSAHGHRDLVDGGVRVALRVREVRRAGDASGSGSHVRLLDRRLLRGRAGLAVAADDAVVLVAEHGHGQFLFFVGETCKFDFIISFCYTK